MENTPREIVKIIKVNDQKTDRTMTLLEEINISNLGIIRQAHLPFSEGLTVITGETGAGKTMVLSALHLLLGKRANNDMIGKYDNNLSVEGCWNLNNSTIIDEIEKTGAIVEDGQVFVNRTIKDTGKGRSVIGGKTTPTSVLSGIGAQLVNIHGQSDQTRLKSKTAQREALDKYAGEPFQKALSAYMTIYKEWKDKKQFIEEVKNSATSRKREINSLKRFIEDFETVNPHENEQEELEKKIDSLSNIDAIRNSMSESCESVSPTDGELPTVSEQLSMLIQSLSKVSHYDEMIEEFKNKATQVSDDFDDLISDIESYIDNIDEDSIEQLYQAQERELELKRFVKKYGNDLNEIIEQKTQAEKELSLLEEYEQPIEELEKEFNKISEKLTKEADKITELRTKAAAKMEKNVNKELNGLSMGGNSLKIVITPSENTTSYGQDEIEFGMLSKGSTKVSQIAKSASGGELSRIMLAIEVVLADTKNIGTFIFDEVDSGVGGETAIEIGKRLAKLSQDAQVIVVTHLPQVAAYADNFLKVVKTVAESETETTVQQLNEKERINELTRMLSGMSNSDLGKAHAKELLEHAKNFKTIETK